MKQNLLYMSMIVLFSLLEILCLVFLVLSILPPSNSSGLELREGFDVSSSLLEEGKYVSQLTGSIINQENQDVIVDKILIVVDSGDETREIALEGRRFSPRREETFLHDWVDTRAFDRIESVKVQRGDKIDTLYDGSSFWSFGFLLSLFGAVLVTIALIYASKQRYYLFQESEQR